MSKSFDISIRIGASLQGAFGSAFGNAKKTIAQLGSEADKVKAKSLAMGQAMAKALADPQANLGKLNREYRELLKLQDQLKAKQVALGASLQRGAELKQQRRELVGSALGTVAAGAAMAVPVIGAGKAAADHQDLLRDIRITGEMTAAEEAKLGATIRRSAVQFNQLQGDVGAGVQVLVAGGIQNAKELEQFAPVLAKTATATRASVDDLGSVLLAMRNNLNVQAGESEAALNILAKSGKMGQFEIRDMAKWLPSLAPMFQTLGVQGPKAVAEIGAALQVARMGAGSNDEAANNFRNFLAKMTAPDTLKDFDKAGIDLTTSLQNLIGKGLTPVNAMLSIVTEAVGQQGPEAAKALQTALQSKDEAERSQALSYLQEATKLGELFQDMQVLNFLRPAMANMDTMKDVQAQSLQAGQAKPGQGVIDKDFALRMATAAEQSKQLQIGLTDLGISIGSALLPSLNGIVQEVLPTVHAFSAWAQANPGMVKGVVMFGAGLVGAKLGIIGFRLAMNLILSPVNAVRTAAQLLGAKWLLLRGPMAAAGQAALTLGRALGGGLLTGLRVAGQAVMILGRALLLNPIGLAVTAIGVAAYLVYKNWATIKKVILDGWSWMKGMGAQFHSAGANLIQGLIDGVSSKLAMAKAKILEIGSSIKGAFTSLLGIHSPSRVFVGYGAAIAEGAALGIAGKQGMAVNRTAAMARDMASAGRTSRLDGALNRLSHTRGWPEGFGGGMTVNFSPTVHIAVNSSGAGVADQVNAGLRMSMREFEQMLARVESSRNRKTMG